MQDLLFELEPEKQEEPKKKKSKPKPQFVPEKKKEKPPEPKVTESNILLFLENNGGSIKTTEIKEQFGQNAFNLVWDMKDKRKINYRYNYLKKHWEFALFPLKSETKQSESSV